MSGIEGLQLTLLAMTLLAVGYLLYEFKRHGG